MSPHRRRAGSRTSRRGRWPPSTATTHTTWLLRGRQQTLTVRFPRPRTLHWIAARVNRAAPAERPTRLWVRAAGHERVVQLGEDRRARLPGWRTRVLRVRVVDSEKAFATSGTRFTDVPPGITGLRVNRRSLAPDAGVPRDFGCGSGPSVRVGNTVLQTRLRASTRQLVRGASVPFSVCGPPTVQVAPGPTDVLAAPNRLFRVDTLLLTSTRAAPAPLTRIVPVTRDDRGDPTAVRVPARSQATVLSLPQNVNSGWTATLHGQDLAPARVDGWRQGWRLPAGQAGTVTLRFAPARTFSVLLVIGAALVVAMAAGLALAALRVRRRPASAHRGPGPLGTGRPGTLDALVAVAAGGLLGGWWGLGGVLAAIAVGSAGPRFAGWALLAGAARADRQPGAVVVGAHPAVLGGHLEPGVEPGRDLLRGGGARGAAAHRSGPDPARLTGLPDGGPHRPGAGIEPGEEADVLRAQDPSLEEVEGRGREQQRQQQRAEHAP